MDLQTGESSDNISISLTVATFAFVNPIMLTKRLLPPVVDELLDEPPEAGALLDDPDDGLVALEELEDPEFALALELLEPELGLAVEELDELELGLTVEELDEPELGLELEPAAFPAELEPPEGLDPALLEPSDFVLSSSFVLVLPPVLILLTPSLSRLLSI